MKLSELTTELQKLLAIWGGETEVIIMLKKGKSLYSGPIANIYPPEIEGDKVVIRGGAYES